MKKTTYTDEQIETLERVYRDIYPSHNTGGDLSSWVGQRRCAECGRPAPGTDAEAEILFEPNAGRPRHRARCSAGQRLGRVGLSAEHDAPPNGLKTLVTMEERVERALRRVDALLA